MLDKPATEPLATLRPFVVGVTKDIPFNVSWPFPRSVLVYSEGLLFRQLGVETWIPRDAIDELYQDAGIVRLRWSQDGRDLTASMNEGFGKRQIPEVLLKAGYVFNV
ncbi:MAG: hypothetical protein J0I70_08035 [Microbacterium sp.]|uniref:hypothetical protein n=1 Tax=Microbacterium sp. TaxID=51671 RepID=UPI0009297649|nr:hypothetical protein [Microbacterium sp.]MBN9174087.1 hypothetical protein [Microbacterium sp.]MBN9187702.1 hypothetical protein [Microbacterium sp.]MBN9193965.1 hypothetical protein [Microbacterium sp.]OJU57098.1 MAG: hypothetical protein BGO04_03680 [Microbacterium sp. 70-38]